MGGAAGAPPVAPPPAPPPGPSGGMSGRYDEQRDNAHDPSVVDRTGWTKLGARTVEGKNDADSILLGRAEGHFSELMLVVEHSSLELYDVEVVFADGTRHSPNLRLVFSKGSHSRVIALPGGKRAIKRVTFKYGNLAGGGRAEVELWGK